MRVYRLQERSDPASGPWMRWPDALCTNSELLDWYSNARSHPGIRSDVERFGPEMLCAVDALEKLAHWFPVAHDEFRDEGYVIGEWEVPDDAVKMGRSGTQLAFRHNYAKLVTTHCPTCIPTNGTF
jgi:hypothetical protein